MCSFQVNIPPLLSPEGTIPASVCTCRPGQLAFFSSSVRADFVHLGTQASSVGVLQAVGVVCSDIFCVRLLPGQSHPYKNNADHTLQDSSLRTNTRVSQNHFMNSGLIQFENVLVFLWLLIITYWNEKFPISSSH